MTAYEAAPSWPRTLEDLAKLEGDIYVIDRLCQWTFVTTHEQFSSMALGPFFAVCSAADEE